MRSAALQRILAGKRVQPAGASPRVGTRTALAPSADTSAPRIPSHFATGTRYTVTTAWRSGVTTSRDVPPG